MPSASNSPEDDYVLPQHLDEKFVTERLTGSEPVLNDASVITSDGSISRSALNECNKNGCCAEQTPNLNNIQTVQRFCNVSKPNSHGCDSNCCKQALQNTSHFSNGNTGYVRSRLFRESQDGLIPQHDEFLADNSISGSIGGESSEGFSNHSNKLTFLTGCIGFNAISADTSSVNNNHEKNHRKNSSWQLFSVTLHRAHPGGFGIAVVGGRDNPHYNSSDACIIVSDVITSGPAFGLLQVNDRIISANGLSLERADYATAVSVMKDSEQLNMIVKRRVPFPFVEFEQRTLKFTLSKSHKKDDFGIVLGCRYYIKEITNPKLAEKDPGLKEGDTVFRVNGQSLESLSLEEATRLLHRSREKLSLVVQRDVRRTPGSGTRWPSQSTVYERLGSISATPRHSPTPVHYTHSANQAEGLPVRASPQLQHNSRKFSDYSPGPKRFSDSVLSAAPSLVRVGFPSPLPLHHHQTQLLHQNSAQLGSDTTRESSEAHHLTMNTAYSQPDVILQQHTPTSSIMSSSSIAGNFTHLQQQQQQKILPYNLTQQSNNSNVKCNFHNSQNTIKQYHYSDSSIYNHQPHSPSNTNLMSKGNGNLSNRDTQSFCSTAEGSELRTVNFRKGSGSLGIRVIGGNQVGIFVSVVQENSPAAKNGINVGDRLHMVNGYIMSGITREQAVEYLLGLGDEVNIQVEHSLSEDFSQIKGGQMGDSFYIRTHFQYQKRSLRQELNFNAGDIFHVTDTLAGGSVGYWQVTKVYSANEMEIKSNEASGIIPNAKTAEILAKQNRLDLSTLGRSIFRKKLQSNRTKSFTNTEAEFSHGHNVSTEDGADITALPAYERVALKKPAFYRPVVLFGPLADVARQLLLANYPLQFGAVVSSIMVDQPSTSNEFARDDDANAMSFALRISSIDAIMTTQRHCILNISPASVERLQLAQYAPIVILIDVDGRTRIRDLRSKCGATTSSARKLMEQTAKIKKHHSYLLTATLDASKEDGWFEALRHLIFHLQERRVWMPEFRLSQRDELLLFPFQDTEAPNNNEAAIKHTPFANSNDFRVYDATSRSPSSIQPTSTHQFMPNERSSTPINSNVKTGTLSACPNKQLFTCTLNGRNSRPTIFDSHNNSTGISAIRSQCNSRQMFDNFNNGYSNHMLQQQSTQDAHSQSMAAGNCVANDSMVNGVIGGISTSAFQTIS